MNCIVTAQTKAESLCPLTGVDAYPPPNMTASCPCKFAMGASMCIPRRFMPLSTVKHACRLEWHQCLVALRLGELEELEVRDRQVAGGEEFGII